LLCRLIGGFFISAEALESAYFSRFPIAIKIFSTIDPEASTGIIPGWEGRMVVCATAPLENAKQEPISVYLSIFMW
jgi:hypothetical protein